MGVWISYELAGTDKESEDYERLIDEIKSLVTAKRLAYSLGVVGIDDAPRRCGTHSATTSPPTTS
jgi:hypothetical protein